MNCVRCGKWITEGVCHVAARIDLCMMCGIEWEASPEGKRLAAISRSIYSEWVERLRCEELQEKFKQANAVAESPKATEDT